MPPRPIQLPTMGGRRARHAQVCTFCGGRGHLERQCGRKAKADARRRRDRLRERAQQMGLERPAENRPGRVDSPKVFGRGST